MDFFTIKSKDINGDDWKLKLELNAEHPVYAGHFPEQAVAPGAMLAEMVKHIIEGELQNQLKMKTARNIKFLNVMLPEKAADVDLTMSVQQEDDITVKAEAKIGEDTYFKISAVYRAV